VIGREFAHRKVAYLFQRHCRIVVFDGPACATDRRVLVAPGRIGVDDRVANCRRKLAVASADLGYLLNAGFAALAGLDSAKLFRGGINVCLGRSSALVESLRSRVLNDRFAGIAYLAPFADT